MLYDVFTVFGYAIFDIALYSPVIQQFIEPRDTSRAGKFFGMVLL